MHIEAFAWIGETLARLPMPTDVLEIGARNINGTVRAWLPWARYIGVDLMPGPDVDVVADGADYQPLTPPDIVICAEVLEHSPRAQALVQHALAIVKPGGAVILTCAGPARAPHSAHDGGPLQPDEYYRGVSVEDITAWVHEVGGSVLDAQDHPSRGDVYVLALKG